MGAAMLSIVGWLAVAGPPSDRIAVEHEPARTLPVRTGAAGVELRTHALTLHGIPLRGAFETTERDAEGHERIVAARSLSEPPRLRPEQAVITRDALPEHLRARGLPSPRTEPRLVYRLVLDRPVLAWEVELPLVLHPEPSLRTVWLSAASGRVLHQIDAVFESRARVFPKNPSTTPDPVEVELFTLEVDTAGEPLASPSIEIFGCGPGPYELAPPWAESYGCVPQPFAQSDELGDYFVPLPDVGRIDDNRAFDDTYAEVAAYHYVEHFFEVMAERGLSEPRCERFTILVNMHSIGEDGSRTPVGGASYIDSCNADVTPTVQLGQGVDADYAWDGDVIYHELGHSIVQQLTPQGLTDRRYGRYGIVSEAGAINEGLADYFAMTVSDDPEVAEYIGRITVASGLPYLRDGNNSKICPDDLISEWHSDSQPVSAALWAMRSRLGVVVDQLVMRALPRLPPDAVLDELGAVLWDVAQQLHGEGELDDFGLAIVERSLRTRGLLECLHVIDDPDLATTGKRMALVAAEGITPFAPGPLQLRYEVPADGREVTIFFSLGGGEPQERSVSVLLRRDGQPVTFTYAFLEEEGFETIVVRSDHQLELTPEALNGEDYIVRLPVEPGEVLHVALANRSPFSVSAGNVFVTASEPSTPPEEDEQPDIDEEPDGCGCRSGAGGVGWGLLPLVVLAMRVRRR